MTQTLASFQAVNLRGESQDLSQYLGKVVLVVNTASLCGFTPQFKGLQTLYSDLQDKGLVILGFPCNQFGNQEPKGAADIGAFCDARFQIKFPLFDKIEVNGAGTHPLYQWLKSEKPGILGTERIKWNFTKFLINRQGEVVERFGSIAKPQAMRGAIEKLL